MKKLTLYISTIALLWMMASCNNTNQIRAKLFVDKYNEELANAILNEFYRSDPRIASYSSAKLLDTDADGNPVIEIILVSRLTYNHPDMNLFKKLVPIIFSNAISANKTAAKLLEEGAKFKIIYTSRNKKLAEELMLDKAKLEMLQKENAKKNLAFAKMNTNSKLTPEIKRLLISFNNSLPIVIDEALQIKVVKIDVNAAKELVYSIEVGNPDGANIKKKEVALEVKRNILSDTRVTRLLGQIKRLGLENIRYIYKNKAGEILNEILLTDADVASAD